MAIPVADSIPPPLSGNNNDGILTDEFISGLLQGSSWRTGSDIGSPVSHVLTYSLNINESESLINPTPGPGGNWTDPANVPMANAVAAALAAWSSVADITFQPVVSGTYYFQSTADLSFTLTGDDLYQSFGALGLAIFPDPQYVNETILDPDPFDELNRTNYPAPEGDVFFDNESPVSAVFDMLDPGGMGLTVILHEIGHALGLKHPGDDGGNFRPLFTDLGIGSYNSMQYTVMSEDIGLLTPSVSGFAATPMPLDILAIQQIYGANLTYNAGDNIYTLANDGVLKTIWDAGGTDTFNASGLSIAVSIDLNPGAFSIHGPNAGPFGNRTAIAYNVTIENATGGSGHDTITGNAAANNLSGGVGDDTISGDAGADTLDGGANDDTLDGGAGNDTLNGGAGNDTLDGGQGIDTLDGGDGDDTHLVRTTATAASTGIVFVADVVTEVAAEGMDTVYSNSSFTLSGEVENLVLTGAPLWRAYVGTGNELNNVLTGQGSARHQLFGNGGDDTLIGGNGRDTLDGGAGFDSYTGGAGDDTYMVDGFSAAHSLLMQGETGDYISQGLSFVFTDQSGTFSVYDAFDMTGDGQVDFLRLNYSGGSHTWTLDFSTDDLGQNLAPGVYTDAQRASFAQSGHPGLDVWGDGRGSNQVYGSFTIDNVQFDYGGASPVLVSFAASFEQHSESPAAPALTGTIRYNVGSDIIESVVELPGGGIDTIQSAVSTVLPANVENLTLTGTGSVNGTGSALANVIVGNGGSNALIGDAGDDTLDGGTGNDVLAGGDGDDRIVWDAADAAIDGGAGVDTLAVAGAGALLDLTALPDEAIRNVEAVDLTGTGDNALTLNLADVLAISLSTDTLRVEGDAGDVVSAGAGWANGGEAAGYRTWTQGAATLVIDADVLQNFVS